MHKKANLFSTLRGKVKILAGIEKERVLCYNLYEEKYFRKGTEK